MNFTQSNRRARGERREHALFCVLCALCGYLFLAAATMLAQSAATGGDEADALSEAARKGDAAAVRKLLDEGVDVNTKFRYNATALSYAADRGHVDVVKLLLERGADVNVKDTFYNATPFTWAISPAMERKPQHDEVVRLLVKSGRASADTLSDALAAATRTKRQDIVELLQQAGAKPKP